MSDQVIVAATSIIVAAIGALGAYLGRVQTQVVATRNAAESAAADARLAELNSKPVSNGFAAKVTTQLEFIVAEQVRQAAVQAAQTADLARLADRFDRHIDRSI